MAVTTGTVAARVRARIGEPTASFWKNTGNELWSWIDEGVETQLQRVLRKWEGSGAPDLPETHFLRHYVKVVSTATAENTADYALPSDCLKVLDVTFSGNPAFRVPFRQDYAVKNYPQMKPVPDEAKWALVDTDKMRLYVTPGSVTVPQSTVSFDIRYLRKITRSTVSTGTVDCREEYTSGPIAYAAAKALDKRSAGEGQTFFVEFDKEVDSIA